MTVYAAVADMAKSQSLLERITACVALEGETSPAYWATVRVWRVVARNDWALAWVYARNQGNPDPGESEAVITDQMILSAVQAVRGTP